jgi:L-alanine-DL-glutamate epimerase-like enolase superfamily enzyme
MKITDLKCAIIGENPVVRITTDAGIDGYGEAENPKSYLKPHVLFYRSLVLGEDPTDVERVMLGIRRFASFKPWGSAVSAIEMALWDIAGKAAGVPVYKLLGGKVRDKVRVYNGGPLPLAEGAAGLCREHGEVRVQKASSERGHRLHSAMPTPGFVYGEIRKGPHPNRSLLTERASSTSWPASNQPSWAMNGWR